MVWLRRVWEFLKGIWGYGCLVILLSVVAAIPIAQFVTLGYMLECSSRVASNRRWKDCFPGALVARRLVICLALVGLTWLPVWYLADLAYSAELIEPGGLRGRRLRIAARIVSLLWIGWISWAVYRGGKLRHFVWPAPIRFVKTAWRPSTWLDAEDKLWNFIQSLQLPGLFWSGLRASFGALVWLAFPASFMLLALGADSGPGAGILGLVGILTMAWVLGVLPGIQIQFAQTKSFWSLFDVRSSRLAFQKAPWSMTLSVIFLLMMATPLYLLRIENIPSELHWILTLFFVFFMFPARLVVAWAWRRATSKEKRAFWLWRYLAWAPLLAAVMIYIGVLYIARFTSWEGAAIFYLQHAFLPPVPFFVQ